MTGLIINKKETLNEEINNIIFGDFEQLDLFPVNDLTIKDLIKINEIKREFLDGIALNDSPVEVQDAIKNVPEVTFDENCYYLDEDVLIEMGITDIDKEQFGYFIVKYDFSNADVEVINTKGYEGYYTLTHIVQPRGSEE